MVVQGWTPINCTIASTDEHGIHTYDIIQLPLLPPKCRSPQCKIGHDLIEEKEREYERYKADSSFEEPFTPTSASKKTNKKTSPKTLQGKYQDYPPDTPDQDIIDGNPELIHYDNLFRLAKRYTIAELANAINASRPEPIVTQALLSNRLKRTVEKIAQRDGKERNKVLDELDQAKKANGVTVIGRKRKKTDEDGGDQKVAKKQKNTVSSYFEAEPDKEKVVKKQKSHVQSDLEADKENVAPSAVGVEMSREAPEVKKPDREVTASGFVKLII